MEQRLVRALAWLRSATPTRAAASRAALAALAPTGAPDPPSADALERLTLSDPRGLQQRIYARLLRIALARSSED